MHVEPRRWHGTHLTSSGNARTHLTFLRLHSRQLCVPFLTLPCFGMLRHCPKNACSARQIKIPQNGWTLILQFDADTRWRRAQNVRSFGRSSQTSDEILGRCKAVPNIQLSDWQPTFLNFELHTLHVQTSATTLLRKSQIPSERRRNHKELETGWL